jgi:hypothetical protein
VNVRSGRFRRTGRIFGAPVLIAVLTVFGLLAALLGEGRWHALAWLALSIPLVAIAWNVWLRGALSRSGRRASYLPGSRHQVSGR